MITPSLLVRPLQRVARLVSNVRATFFTRPSLVAPRRTLSQGAPPYKYSFLACLCVRTRSSLGQSICARVNEHRHPEDMIDLVCRVPRARGLTRLILLFPCGRWASTRDQRATPSPLVRVGRAKETNSLRLSLSCARCASTGDQQPLSQSPLLYVEGIAQLHRPIFLNQAGAIERPVLFAVKAQLEVAPAHGDAKDPVQLGWVDSI